MTTTRSSGAAARALAVAAGTLALAVGLAGAGAQAVATAAGPAARVDEVVVAVVLLGASVAASVLALGSAAVCTSTVARASGRRLRRVEILGDRLTPVVLRRVVGVGVAVGLGMSGATAASASETDLGWLATTTGATATEPAVAPVAGAAPAVEATVPTGRPDAEPTTGSPPASGPRTPTTSTRPAPTHLGSAAGATATGSPTRDLGAPTGGPGSSAPTPGSAASGADPGLPTSVGSDQRTVVVRPGDTLWSIAAATVPDGDDAAVAAAWPRWYAANADRIGADPDLILPGTVLVTPSEEAAR